MRFSSKAKLPLWDIAMVISRFGSIDPIQSNNGVLVANYNLAKEFAKSGKKTCLLANINQKSDIQLNGIQLFHIDGSSDEALADCLQRIGGCDTLIENSNATACRKKICNRFLVIMHNRHHLWGVEQYGRAIYQLPSAVVCVSRYSLEENLKWGVPRKLLKCIPNGCDFKVFYKRDVIRNPQRLIFAGYTSNRKGIHKAIETFNFIKKDFFPELELVVCGKQAPWSESPECSSWQDRGWLGIDKCINWEKIQSDCKSLTYLGEIPPHELAVEFSKSAFLILPSNIDTFGLVCVEAQGCGCIPIVPDDSCLAETLEPQSRNRFSFRNHDYHSLSKILLEALNSRELENYRTQNMEFVKSSFSWNKAASEYIKLLDAAPAKMHMKITAYRFIKALTSLSSAIKNK